MFSFCWSLGKIVCNLSPIPGIAMFSWNFFVFFVWLSAEGFPSVALFHWIFSELFYLSVSTVSFPHLSLAFHFTLHKHTWSFWQHTFAFFSVLLTEYLPGCWHHCGKCHCDIDGDLFAAKCSVLPVLNLPTLYYGSPWKYENWLSLECHYHQTPFPFQHLTSVLSYNCASCSVLPTIVVDIHLSSCGWSYPIALLMWNYLYWPLSLSLSHIC